MSVCDGCPQLIDVSGRFASTHGDMEPVYECLLVNFDKPLKASELPDTCPDGVALKARWENPELVLVAVPKDAESVTVHRAKDHGDHITRHITRWDSTLNSEPEEKVCGTCKFNSDSLIRICYGCLKYSKWEPEETGATDE